MRTLNLKMNFIWDEEDDTKEFRLTVPDNVSDNEIAETLKKEHEYLCGEDDEDIYGSVGRAPETLLDYVCDKYGWSWCELEFNVDIDLV